MVSHLFTTPVLREKSELTAEQRQEICIYLLDLRAKAPGEQKSNRGGWHSPGNLFAPEHRQFPVLREAVTKAVLAYIGEVTGFRGEIQMGMTGWTVINRPGDYNVPHNHAANLLSGALYLSVPEGMRGGAISFQDPRLNLNAHDSEAMRKRGVKVPWMAPNVAVTPVTGEILIFPSWLIHWVEPYQCDDPEALRIVISFNATIG